MFNLHLLHPGIKSEAIIDKIIELTGKDPDIVAHLVEKRQIIARDLESREAKRIKGELELLGAQVILLPIGDFELPSKPLKTQVIDSHGQPLVNAQVSIKTRKDGFDSQFEPQKSKDEGITEFPDFSVMITEFFEELPPLWFEVVMEDGRFLATTKQAFNWETFMAFPKTIFVVQTTNNSTEDQITSDYRVHGKVLLADEEPAKGIIVQAFDKDLRSEQLLGESVTDTLGHYEINYHSDQFLRADKGRADLVLKVFDTMSNELDIEPIGDEESVIFNAEKVIEVNVLVKSDSIRSESLYEKIVVAIKPLLDGVSLSQITWEDAQFLNHEVDYPSNQIFWISEDTRLTLETDLPTSVFFAWAMANIGVDLEDGIPALDLAIVLQHNADKLVEEILSSAIERNIIPDVLVTEDARDRLIQQIVDLKEKSNRESKQVQRKRIEELGNLAELDDQEIKVLKKLELDALIGDSVILDKLVKQGQLSEDKKDALNLTLNLSALTEKRTKVVELLRDEELANGKPKQLKDFVVWDKKDWNSFLERHAIDPDEGITREEHASLLNQRIEQLYPTATWFQRHAMTDRSSDWEKLNRIESLFEQTDNLFNPEGPENVNFDPLPDPEQTKHDVNSLNELVNVYAPMGLRETFNDSGLSVNKKIGFAKKQIKLLKTFYKNNSDFDFSKTPMSVLNGELELNLNDIPENEHARIINTLKREQRLLKITSDQATSSILASNGINGAQDIIRVPRATFLSSPIATKLDNAAIIYDRSREIVSNSAHILFNLNEVSGIFNRTLGGNLGKDLDALRKLPGYEDIFGSTSYCSCSHCQSIYSPAAYFVDIMRWLEDYVLTNANITANSTLDLERRRPDLWHLSLNCENTNTPIRTLTLVNEVLESFAAKEIGNGNNNQIDLTNRTEIEAQVYGSLLKESQQLNTLPFDLNRTEIQAYLSHMGHSIFEIEALTAVSGKWPLHVYGFGQMEYDLITNPSHKRSFLTKLYGNEIVGTTGNPNANLPDQTIPDTDVHKLMQKLSVSRKEFGRLIDLSFIDNGQISIEQTTSPGAVQSDREVLTGATFQTLDRLHRFVRLWRHKKGWSIEELDLFFEVYSDIDSDFIIDLIHHQYIIDQLQLRPEQVFSLVFHLSNIAMKSDGISLLDRLFNDAIFTDVEESLPGTKPFIHPSHPDFDIDGDSLPKAPGLSRFLGALRLSGEDFIVLLEHLFASGPQHLKFETNLENLSLLYRHTILAERLELTISDLFRMIGYCPSIEGTFLQNVNEIIDLIDFVRSTKEIGISMDYLANILQSKSTAAISDQLKASAATRDQILEEVHSDGVLWFSNTVFSTLEGVEEPYAQQLLDQFLVTELEAAVPNKERFKLTNNFKTESSGSGVITIPQILIDRAITEQLLRDHLMQYTVGHVLPIYLAKATGLSEVWIATLMHILNVDLQSDEYFNDIHNTSSPLDENAPLTLLIERLQPWVSTIIVYSLDAKTFQLISDDSNQNRISVTRVFSISDTGMPTWETLRRIYIYNKLVAIQPQQRDTLHELLTLSDSVNFLEYLNNAGDKALKKLVKVLSDDPENSRTNETNIEAIIQQQWDNQIYSLFEFFKENNSGLTISQQKNRLEVAHLLREVHLLHRPFLLATSSLTYLDVTLDMLFRLYRQLKLQRSLGIGVQTLNDLTSLEFDVTSRVSRSLLAALKANYDETRWDKIEDELDENLSEKKRDALQSYFLKTFPDLFASPSDLFHFFLLDTDFGGCAKTSRLKAATLSLQLYIHRIQLNLEQTEEDQGLLNEIDSKAWQEWKWMKNYRIWEANRKVFLYPENYLEPDFRDNCSSQYNALAEELMQNELNEDTVTTAYKKYLTQFEKLSQLRIAGAYYDRDEDTLYIFGINTNKDCYMRKFVRQVTWTPWVKLDFPVDSQYVSAIKFNGKLYLFWLRSMVQEVKKFKEGSSITDDLSYKRTLKYASQNSNGHWEVPQEIVVDTLLGISRSLTQDVKKHLEDHYFSLKLFLNTVERKGRNELVINIGLDGFHSYQTHEIFSNYYRLDFFKNRLEKTQIVFHEKPVSIVKMNSGDAFFDLRRVANDKGVAEALYGSTDPLISKEKLLEDVNNKVISTEQDIATNYYGNNILHINDIPYLLMNDRKEVDLVKEELTGLAAILEAIVSAIVSAAAILSSFKVLRLTTTLTPRFQKLLYNHGLEAFLSTTTQELREIEFPFQATYDNIELPKVGEALDFKGAMGNYFRELFHHIPFKIAHQANINNRFKEAQKWLHYIFNPLPDNDNADPKNFWQYIEFRNHNITTLREQLQDEDAITAYKRDPFNPFAIARLRLSAFQKAVFMKYVDNLIDWGDYLFTQDTMETINEANILYIMASDLLGERPVAVGECAVNPDENERTYHKIKQLRTSEFLYEIEHVEWVTSETTYGTNIDPITKTTYETANSSTSRIYTQIPVFCIPENKKLLSYWDRVDDRLFKIRNCMNIEGLERQLALFQPPIDPALLVRARAAGLSIDEMMASVNSPLPLYRFPYLLEKAKSYASQVQSFGGSLLSLLERKDAAQLTLLLNEQQQELQQETRKIKEYKFKEIEQQYLSWELDMSKNRLRKAHIIQLASENNEDGGGIGSQYGISKEEKKQIELLEVSTGLKILSGYFSTAASIAYAVPQVGAPTSMNYGGREVGAVLSAISFYSNSGALIADMEGRRSSLVGSYKRRHKEWMHQLNLVEQEEEQLRIQRELLDLRKEVTEKELSVFDKTGEQTLALYEFHKNKFTNEQLYAWMLSETRKMFREAYRTAQEMAKLAEQAYHFERDEDQSIYVQSGHWDANYNGLLAGERLSLQLQRMERAYLEKEQRNLEIDQAFSLLQIAPEQLLTLRNTGKCQFTIPEFIFDLTYPGHYRRKIKSVRLTLPCITGPYTNVGVTLTLLGSKIRMEPELPGDLIAVPRARNQSIATSSAQNDGGQFNLDFGGARYLPFEGAGAVESEWQINLPDQFRTFDYNTIADVIVHISYTAKNGIQRDAVENRLQTIFQAAEDHVLKRYISLKQEFSSEFHRLLHRPITESMNITMKRKNFPFFLRNAKSIEVVPNIKCFLYTSGLESVGEFELISNENVTSSSFEKFTVEDMDLFQGSFVFLSDFKLNKTIDTITISLAINKLGELDNGQEQVNIEQLKDIVLLLEYKATF